jgi:hypothetical protein
MNCFLLKFLVRRRNSADFLFWGGEFALPAKFRQADGAVIYIACASE